MKIGIVGLPQSGKKTLFALLTGIVPDPEKAFGGKGDVLGKADIRDKRFVKLTKMYEPKSEVPGTIDLSLLPDLQNDPALDAEVFRKLEVVDAVCYVVRSFNDDSVYHVAGSVDPVRDVSDFLSECILADLLFVEKRLERLGKELHVKKEPKKIEEQQLMERLKVHLEEEKPLSVFSFTSDQLENTKSYPLISRKPLIIIVNIGDDEIGEDSAVSDIQKLLQGDASACLDICIKLEQEIADFDTDEERAEFMEEMGIKEPALDRLTVSSYKVLGLLTYFTVGKDEVRAWMVKKGSTAPRAARAIHADFERGFIRAEVIKYDDLIELGSEAAVKDAGKLSLKGKEYVVEDGDIISFLFNV